MIADPDPLRERECSPAAGIIQRYPDRALVLAARSCFATCAFCTRLGFVTGREDSGLAVDTATSIAWLRKQESIREVLVSGGDPLTLDDADLENLLGSLRSIPHVKILRLATRAPHARPERITPDLCAMIASHGPVLVAVHFNHPGELTREALAACGRLVDAGLPLLNQAVLLGGVNDDARVLSELCFGLAAARIRPYYLLQCDRVAGTERFWVGLGRALDIMGALEPSLPGHAVPAFVVDLPGWEGKARLEPSSPPRRVDDGWLLRGRSGREILYPDPVA